MRPDIDERVRKRFRSDRRMTRDDFLKCIDDEPECPGDMPDEMWSKIVEHAANDDRDFFIELVRLAIRLTKEGIKHRFIQRIKFNQVQRR